jgi:ribosomal protein S1
MTFKRLINKNNEEEIEESSDFEKMLNESFEKMPARKTQQEASPEAAAAPELPFAVGDRIKGTVKRLENFGAFIEIAPRIDGLAHISELSWNRIKHPSELLTLGQSVSVEVLSIEQNRGRPKVSLSLKNSADNPWNSLSFKAGQIVSGKVTRCKAFGAFVELAPGIEGLIPLAELSSTKRANRVEDFVNEGETVSVLVKSIDTDSKRVSLSLKGAQDQSANLAESQDYKDYAAKESARSSQSALGSLGDKLQAALSKKPEDKE